MQLHEQNFSCYVSNYFHHIFIEFRASDENQIFTDQNVDDDDVSKLKTVLPVTN